MNVGGHRGVREAAARWQAAGRRFALALVTDTEGSTYRKAGALALVAEDGERLGTLSGGCLEPALEALGLAALASGRVEVALLDTRGDDDLLFGSGSGCRGRLRVLAWPVPGPGETLLAAVRDATAAGLPLDAALCTDGPAAGSGWLACGGRTQALGDGPLPEAALAEAPGWRDAHGPARARLVLPPPPRLLLVGAGPEAAPLLRLARTLGWWVAIADTREALLHDQALADADARLLQPPAGALAALSPAPHAVLAMTHRASTDLAALRAMAGHGAPYLGLLGPPARRDELLAGLDDGLRAALRDRLRAPVGLPLGGDGPEAIALAIAADLQRHFHAAP